MITNVLTVTAAAEELGVCASRVRQLCIEHNIGTRMPSVRLLTYGDVGNLRRLLSKMSPRRPRGKISAKSDKVA